MGKLLLVDDNQVYRLGMRELIRSVRPDLEICEADRYADARLMLRETSDIVLLLMDIKVSDGGGFVGLFQLRSEYPRLPIIILSNSVDSESVSRALTFGAAGYISKSASRGVIERTLKATLSENDWTPAPLIAGENLINPIAALSPALLRVLAGLKRGLRNKEIAFELGLAEKTVKAYMSVLYRKLGVNSRTQALLLLQEMPLDLHVQSGAVS
jgi:DNA-binding NarL/FixJ family response regulator